MSSGRKLLNKSSTLPKRLKLLKKQSEFLELKSSINEMRNALESTGNRADQKEEGLSELKVRNLEVPRRKKREN